MELTVRRARPEDLPKLQQLGTELMLSDKRFDSLLEKQWYFSNKGSNYLLRSIKGRNRICLVAETGDEIVGYASGRLLAVDSWRPVKRAELGNLLVTEQYRNHRAGHALISAFKKWGKDKGAEKIKVVTSALNEDAIRFYKNNGFKNKDLVLEAEIKTL